MTGSAIGTLWLAAEVTTLVVIAIGAVSHRWTGWASRPWWFVLAVLAFVDLAGRFLAIGQTIAAGAYAVLALLAFTELLRAVRRGRDARTVPVERWDPRRGPRRERAVAHSALLAFRASPKRTRNAAEEAAKQDLFRVALEFTRPRPWWRFW